MIGGHQFVAIGKIDAINARVHVRGATHEDVDLFGARFFEIVYARLASRATNDGIIRTGEASRFLSMADAKSGRHSSIRFFVSSALRSKNSTTCGKRY